MQRRVVGRRGRCRRCRRRRRCCLGFRGADARLCVARRACACVCVRACVS
jgi:hypothetical protein